MRSYLFQIILFCLLYLGERFSSGLFCYMKNLFQTIFWSLISKDLTPSHQQVQQPSLHIHKHFPKRIFPPFLLRSMSSHDTRGTKTTHLETERTILHHVSLFNSPLKKKNKRKREREIQKPSCGARK